MQKTPPKKPKKKPCIFLASQIIRDVFADHIFTMDKDQNHHCYHNHTPGKLDIYSHAWREILKDCTEQYNSIDCFQQ